MDNPYETPKAELVDKKSDYALLEFDKFSTWYVVGLTIITLGLYWVYWIYTRTEKLNTLPGVSPIGNGFIYSAAAFYVLSLPIGFAAGYFVQTESAMLFSDVFGLVANVLLLVWAFKFRNRLNDYLDEFVPSGATLGPVLTFLLQVFYLSYKLNQNIEMLEESLSQGELQPA